MLSRNAKQSPTSGNILLLKLKKNAISKNKTKAKNIKKTLQTWKSHRSRVHRGKSLPWWRQRWVAAIPLPISKAGGHSCVECHPPSVPPTPSYRVTRVEAGQNTAVLGVLRGHKRWVLTATSPFPTKPPAAVRSASPPIRAPDTMLAFVISNRQLNTKGKHDYKRGSGFGGCRWFGFGGHDEHRGSAGHSVVSQPPTGPPLLVKHSG